MEVKKITYHDAVPAVIILLEIYYKFHITKVVIRYRRRQFYNTCTEYDITIKDHGYLMGLSDKKSAEKIHIIII